MRQHLLIGLAGLVVLTQILENMGQGLAVDKLPVSRSIGPARKLQRLRQIPPLLRQHGLQTQRHCMVRIQSQDLLVQGFGLGKPPRHVVA